MLVPADVRELNIRIENVKSGKVWFDDVKIVKGNTAKTVVVEESNYYPFGLKHKGYNNVVSSNGNSVAQKFGYNGKEHNEELGLDWIDFGWRNHDASLGRWMNIDNKAEKYYNYSPYTYAANNPIYYIDPDGQDIIIHYQDEDGNDQTHTYVFGGTYDGGNQYIKDVYSSLSYIIDNDADVTNIIKDLSGDKFGDVNLFDNTKENNPLIKDSRRQTYFRDKGANTGKDEIIWDSRKGAKFTNTLGFFSLITGNGYTEDGQISPAESLLHELGHAKSSLEDPDQHKIDSGTGYEETDVINTIERPASKKLGRKVLRGGHYGYFYKTVSPTSVEPAKEKKKKQKK